MAEYNNTLDTWYQSCPSPVRSVLQSPYNTVSGWLHWVTGEPNTVAGQCGTYQSLGQQVLQVGQQLSDTANGISLWEGEAHDAYMAKMGLVRGNFDKLGPAIQQTQEILRAAAETSVEAANMILSVIRSVIEFLMTSLAIAGALAVFTLGASMGAWVAANLAKGAHALAKISQGLARVAQVLTRIANLLEKLATIMKKVAEILKELRALLKLLAELKKDVGLVGKGVISVATGLARTPIKLAADAGLGGVSDATGVPGLSMPGGAGEAKQAAEDAWDAVSASNRATRANTGVQLD
ncbi:MAG: hypothetical protein ABIS84_08260 [Arachnia sp.]